MITSKRIAIIVFSIYGFFIFIVLMVLLLPFFIVAFFLPRPWDGNAVYKISYVWALLFFFFTGIKYKHVQKCRLEKNHSYVFVTNHISYLDIPMMILATRDFSVRILGKAEMTRIPVFGFIYKTGAVTVKRDSPEDRKESIRKLKDFLKEKISILICPEGTFNMTGSPLKEFYDGAFRIAIELQEPIVPIIFPDTYDRLNYHSIFSLSPGICRAIILSPVSTIGMNENDIPELRRKIYSIMEKEVLQLNASWIKKV